MPSPSGSSERRPPPSNCSACTSAANSASTPRSPTGR
jgi:hypothetical protein